jgi:hypothetical protein
MIMPIILERASNRGWKNIHFENITDDGAEMDNLGLPCWRAVKNTGFCCIIGPLVIPSKQTVEHKEAHHEKDSNNHLRSSSDSNDAGTGLR